MRTNDKVGLNVVWDGDELVVLAGDVRVLTVTPVAGVELGDGGAAADAVAAVVVAPSGRAAGGARYDGDTLYLPCG